MKKSEIMVSMPMTTYEELLAFKKEYENLCNKIRGCFNFDYFATEDRIDFDTNKALNLGREFLPNRCKIANIIKTE